MVDLRREAKGRECQIRIPGICSGDPTTTVLAHLRMVGVSGMGIRSEDVLGSHACHRCHDVVDFRVSAPFTRDEIKLMHHEGVARTISLLVSERLLKW